MADVFRTPEGLWTIYDKNDMRDLLRHFCGDEVAKFCLTRMIEYDTEKERTEMEFNSDFESVQFQNEEYHDCILDAHEQITTCINDIQTAIYESKKLNRIKLMQKLISIKDDLWNMI